MIPALSQTVRQQIDGSGRQMPKSTFCMIVPGSAPNLLYDSICTIWRKCQCHNSWLLRKKRAEKYMKWHKDMKRILATFLKVIHTFHLKRKGTLSILVYKEKRIHLWNCLFATWCGQENTKVLPSKIYAHKEVFIFLTCS